MKPTLPQHAAPSDDVLFQEVGGEAVLLDLASESYFGLDPVGTRLWTLLAKNPSLDNAFEVLCGEYDVEPQRLRSDLITIVEQLAQAGLVKVN